MSEPRTLVCGGWLTALDIGPSLVVPTDTLQHHRAGIGVRGSVVAVVEHPVAVPLVGENLCVVTGAVEVVAFI